MGNERYKLLKDLNLKALLPEHRAAKYRDLWNEFLSMIDFLNADKLYGVPETRSFQSRAKAWVAKLTEPSRGDPKSPSFVLGMCDTKCITPYIHCLAHHMAEFLDLCTSIKTPLLFFSSEPVEKKNHLHVQLFYSKTRMDGVNAFQTKTSVEEILEIENRELYFNFVNEEFVPPKVRKVHINKRMGRKPGQEEEEEQEPEE